MDGVSISGGFLDPIIGLKPQEKKSQNETSASQESTRSPQAERVQALLPLALRAVLHLPAFSATGAEPLAHTAVQNLELLLKELRSTEKRMKADDPLKSAVTQSVVSLQNALDGPANPNFIGLRKLSSGRCLSQLNFEQQDPRTQDFCRSLVKLSLLSSARTVNPSRVTETLKGLKKGPTSKRLPPILQVLDGSPLLKSFIKNTENKLAQGGEESLGGLSFWRDQDQEGLLDSQWKDSPEFRSLEALSSALLFLKKDPSQAKLASVSNVAMANPAITAAAQAIQSLFSLCFPGDKGLGILGGALLSAISEKPRAKNIQPKPPLEATVLASTPTAVSPSQINVVGKALGKLVDSMEAILQFLSGDPSPPTLQQWEDMWEAGTTLHNFQVWYNHMPSDPPPGITDSQWSQFQNSCSLINNAVSNVFSTALNFYEETGIRGISAVTYDMFHHNNGATLDPSPLSSLGVSSVSPATTQGPRGNTYWTNEVQVTFDNGETTTIPLDSAMTSFVQEFNSLYGDQWSTGFLGQNPSGLQTLLNAAEAALGVIQSAQSKWNKLEQDSTGIIAHAIQELQPIAATYQQEIQYLSEIAGYTADLVNAFSAIKNFISGNPSPPSLEQWEALWDAGTTLNNYQTWYNSLDSSTPPPGVSQDQWNQFLEQAGQINSDINTLFNDIENPEYSTSLTRTLTDMLTHTSQQINIPNGPKGSVDGVTSIAPVYTTGPDGQSYMTNEVTVTFDDGTTNTVPVDQAMETFVPLFNNFWGATFGPDFWTEDFIGANNNTENMNQIISDLNGAENDLMNISDNVQADMQQVEALLMTLAKMFESIIQTMNKIAMTEAQSYAS